MRRFTDHAALTSFVGSEVVLSKIGLITRTRAGKTKHRIVVDSKASGVSRAARRHERCVLPRVSDVLGDIVQLLVAALAQNPLINLSTSRSASLY